MGPIVIRSGRHPYVVSLAVGLVIAHLYGLVVAPASVSVDAALEPTTRTLFGVCSASGAALILSGIYWRRDLLTGLLVERIGHILLGTGSAAYVAVLCTISTFNRSGLITIIGCAISVGAAARIVQITRDARALRVGQ